MKRGLKLGPIAAFVVIAGALAFGASAFVTNLIPYVKFADAIKQPNQNVQVLGALDKSDIRFDGALNFTIIEKETGQRMRVRFGHSKPANFENAIEVAAIGRWDGHIFQADNLLVKCPSKYQGTETKSYSSR